MNIAIDREGRLVGGRSGLYRSTDRGDTWVALDTSTAESIGSIAIDSSGRIIAARGSGIAWFDETNRRWERLASSPEVRATIRRVVVMPDGTLFALEFRDGVLRSTDGGATWTRLGVGVCVDIDVSGDGLLVILEGDRLLASRDRGTTLTEVGGADWMSALSVSIAPTGRVFVATRFGLYRSSGTVLSAPSDRYAAERRDDIASVAVHPNPARDRVEIEYVVAHRAPVRITVLDAGGRVCLRMLEGTRDAGIHRVALDVGALSAGVHFVRVEAGRAVSTTRLLTR